MKRKELKQIYKKTLGIINRPMIEYVDKNGIIWVKPSSGTPEEVSQTGDSSGGGENG